MAQPKVVYDISVIGLGQNLATARTGIYRVVENLLLAVAASSELQLHLSAFEHCQMWAAARRWQSQQPTPISALPFIGPSGVVVSALRQLLSFRLQLDGIQPAPLALRASRRLLRELTDPLLANLDLLPATGLQEKGVSFLFSPYWPLPKRIPSQSAISRAVLLHDLLPITQPKLAGGDGGLFLRKVLGSVGERDWVFCVSEFTRQEVTACAPHLTANRVRLLRPGVANIFCAVTTPMDQERVRQKYGLGTAPFFLSVGTLEQRKNLVGLLTSFGEWLRAHPHAEANLVLVGAGSNARSQILAKASELELPPDRLHLTGFVPDDDLPALYQSAVAFLFPSFAEGFGLPPLEAMRSGIPVVSSNTTSLPEVVGEAGMLLPPTDTAGWVKAMNELVTNGTLRRELSERGRQRAELFAWDKTAAAFASLVREATSSLHAKSSDIG